ncbi:MAG: hypothetical protein M1132_13005 [Chloroflexi bacterium]|nr:hypothetical protein [Chloroflexota bacterium]
MEMLDALTRLFSGPKKKTIDDITEDELRLERIRLEQEESKMIKRVDDMETQKKQLFQKGVEEASPRQREIVAGKIKDLDSQARGYDKTLKLFAHQLRIINGFIQIKENRRLLTQLGLSSVISKIDLSELRNYVERETVNGDFQVEKLKDIVTVLEDSGGVMKDSQVDKDTQDIVALMEKARAAQTENPGAIEEGFKQVNQVLAPEPSEKEP